MSEEIVFDFISINTADLFKYKQCLYELSCCDERVQPDKIQVDHQATLFSLEKL